MPEAPSRAAPEARALTIARLVAAPPTLAFDAFTDPAHLSRWWGPDGFTTTTSAHDLRAGGRWHFTMHGPDGTDWPNLIVYREVVRGARLAWDHHGADATTPEFTTVVTFAPQEGGTLVTLRTTFPSLEALEEKRRIGAEEGGRQTLGRFAAHLATLVHSAPLVLTRTFDAPRALVWRMWTEPAHFARWWGPEGWTCPICEIDARPGGTLRFTMRGPDGMEVAHAGRFREVAEPARLDFALWFTDAEGRRDARALFPDWPAESLFHTAVTLEERDGRTTMTVTQVAEFPGAVPASFAATRDGWEGGWSQSLARMAREVAARRDG